MSGGGSSSGSYRDWRDRDGGTAWSRDDWRSWRDDNPYGDFGDFRDWWEENGGGSSSGGDTDAGGVLGLGGRRTFQPTLPGFQDRVASQLQMGFGAQPEMLGLLQNLYRPMTFGMANWPPPKRQDGDSEDEH